MTVIEINTKAKTYPIIVTAGLIKNAEQIAKHCQSLASRWVIIADENLLHDYAKPLQQQLKQYNPACDLLSFTASEATKSREQKQQLEDQLFELGCHRDTCLIALGGGVSTDLVGFVAATFCRGVPVIYLPTSLLAMVDASIGGKTGVNTPFGKNLIGSFNQPDAVLIDPLVLKTLPQALFADGMAEVIKHAVLADKSLCELLTTQQQDILSLEQNVLLAMIHKSLIVKKQIVEQDEQEKKGPRQLLNLGHTVAHALELASKHQLSHGQAVALGLLAETRMAVASGYCQPDVLTTLAKLLAAYQLPIKSASMYMTDELIELMRLDKKNKGTAIYFSLLADIATPYVSDQQYSHPIDEQVIATGLQEIF